MKTAHNLVHFFIVSQKRIIDELIQRFSGPKEYGVQMDCRLSPRRLEKMCKQIAILCAMGILCGCMELEDGSYADVLSPMTMDVRFVHKEWSVTSDGTVVPHGGGCERFGSPGGASMGGGFDVGEDGQFVSMSTQTEQDAVKVDISFKAEVVYQNSFNESFLKTGEIEEFSFTTPDGSTFFFQFFGASSCDVDYLDIDSLDAGTSSADTGTEG